MLTWNFNVLCGDALAEEVYIHNVPDAIYSLASLTPYSTTAHAHAPFSSLSHLNHTYARHPPSHAHRPRTRNVHHLPLLQVLGMALRVRALTHTLHQLQA